jgi:hypothetical protein
LEQLRPGIFGTRKHLKGEMLDIRVERAPAACRTDLLRAWGNSPTSAAKSSERAQEEIADYQNDHSADAETARDQGQKTAEPSSAKSAAAEAHASTAGIIDKIAAFAFVAEPHLIPPVALAQCLGAAPVAIQASARD